MKFWFIVFVGLLLAMLGFGVRRAVMNAQYRTYGADIPFTLESALQFRYVKSIIDGAGIPEVDTRIEYPDGVVVRETYSIGAEYVYAFLSKMLPDSLDLTRRVRLVAAGWFCLGIPFMCLWMWWWLRSRWAAIVAGSFYAVSLAAVIRSTGQELSRENFALPFLIAHLAFSALCKSPDRKPWVFRTGAVLSALCLAMAVSFWDLVQFYIILWTVYNYAVIVSGSLVDDARALRSWLLSLAGLIAAGVVVPYLRVHSFLCSYAMLLNYGIAVIACAAAYGEKASWRLLSGSTMGVCLRAAVPLCVVLGGWVALSGYMESYGHFAGLLWAKLRYLNIKPVDPACLTFEQSILWAPALNSANMLLTRMYFPVSLWLCLLSIGLFPFDFRLRTRPGTVQILFYFSASLLTFILFVRFHVFLVVFVSALLGCMAWWSAGRGSWLRWSVAVILIYGAIAEGAHVINDPARWGRPLTYYREKKELVHWLASRTECEPVLANFGLSAFLTAYVGCPTILHPKFESSRIRQRVRDYGVTLFKGDEEALRDWADSYGARYLVYSMGEFADERVDLQMRYCVDALDPPADSAARLLEERPEHSRYFVWLWDNRKYRVFAIVTRESELKAKRLSELARIALECDHMEEAENLATVALTHDQRCMDAAEVLVEIARKRESNGVAP